MIISNSRKFIYIHLHKAAGTSVEQALDPWLAWNDVILGSTDYGESLQPLYERRFGLNKHSNAQQCFDVVGESIWDSYFTFSTVRTPYSLVVSTYTFAGKTLDAFVARFQLGERDLLCLAAGGELPRKGPLSRLIGGFAGRGVG